MNALTELRKLARRREVEKVPVTHHPANPPQAAKARKRLVRRWVRDPESGRLICVWSLDEARQDAERSRGFQLAA